MVGGELIAPFTTAMTSQRVQFAKYSDACGKYRHVVEALVLKAKLHSVEIILPLDILTGEEPISPEAKQRVYTQVDKDARDEGFEYDEDVKTIALGVSESKVVEGYIFDIGPQAVEQLQQVLKETHMCVSWGTMGICEGSAFQAGQRALVQGSVQRSAVVAGAEGGVGSDTGSTIPTHTIVIGDAAVEWFCRIADPDGELGGDLMRAKMVSYLQRSSALFTAAMCSMDISALWTALSPRTPLPDECTFVRAAFAQEGEEEEEEEEEDEEEED